jgi:hypothetical protein
MAKQKVVLGYKFVTADLRSKNGDCTWVVGEWKHDSASLELCTSGLHACVSPLDSLEYVYGDRWFLVAAKGTVLHGADKFCASDMKLVRELPVKTVLVAFAVECAKHCYANWKAFAPDDGRVWAAIVAAENYMKNPTEENRSAESAARSAAWSAARSAAWSAESAARSAASAAWSAAWSAASAAWSAESAAWSAESAAWSAAWSAASAAWSAERTWQLKTLNRLIRQTQKTEASQ